LSNHDIVDAVKWHPEFACDVFPRFAKPNKLMDLGGKFIVLSERNGSTAASYLAL